MESSSKRRSELLREFRSVVDTGAEMALDEAMLIVSSSLTSGFDILDFVVRIDEIASDVASPTIEGITRALFRSDDPYLGNSSDYYNPSNSLLDQVLIGRKGIPITLSVLMIEVGRRLGVPLVGVGMPGHFLVGSFAPMGKIPELFVDTFHGGEILDIDGCRQLFERLLPNSMRHSGAFDPRFLAAVHPIAILDRSLANLKAIYSAAGHEDLLRIVMALRSHLPGLGRVERDEFHRLMAPFN